jgi:hypothetical protein
VNLRNELAADLLFRSTRAVIAGDLAALDALVREAERLLPAPP